MLDLHRMRLLHEFSQRGTLAAVAEALSYSPSTISQQFATLERETGVALLERTGRRLQLTPQGRALAAAASELLDAEERARSALEEVRPESMTVRVAVFQSAAHAIVPEALTILGARHPDLRIEIAEVAPEEGLFEVAARGYDLAVAEQYPGHTREHRAGLRREVLGRDPIRLALPPERQPVALTDLRDAVWVMEPRGTAARQWAVQQCRGAGFEPDVRYEAADLMAHVRLITTGHAVGMLPDLVWAGAAPTVTQSALPHSPFREVFTAVRTASARRTPIRAVHDALRASLELSQTAAHGLPTGRERTTLK